MTGDTGRGNTMEFKLRRIRFGRGYRIVGAEDPNPFERLTRRPDYGSPLRLCFHTRGLTGLSGEPAAIIAELCAPYRKKALHITRTPGEAPSDWRDFPTFELSRWSDDTGTVSVDRGSTSIMTGVQPLRDWAYEIRKRLEKPEQRRGTVELLAARELDDIDLMITGDDDLLALRSAAPINLLPLLAPHEAFPIVGLWSRAIGESYLAGPINVADWYPVVLAHALVRGSWTDLALLIDGSDALPDRADLRELTTSIFTRLARVISTLDQLALKWLRRTQYGGDIDLDQIVLGVSAIQDNLALLAGRFLQISLPRPLSWSLRSDAWRSAIAAAGGQRGQTLRQYVVDADPWLRVPLELRHHAVHRSVLSSVRHMRFPDPEERIRLPEGVAAPITQALNELHESPLAWGITPSNLVGDTTLDLDPLPFAAKLIAGTAGVVNGIVRRLHPSGDARYPGSVRPIPTLERPRFLQDHIFSPENCSVALLSSPLSGLVEAA